MRPQAAQVVCVARRTARRGGSCALGLFRHPLSGDIKVQLRNVPKRKLPKEYRIFKISNPATEPAADAFVCFLKHQKQQQQRQLFYHTLIRQQHYQPAPDASFNAT